jgi:tRNA(fMet)-specific endonuclease VapC
MDMLIAAHALSLRCALVTNNEAEFARVPRLRVKNWAKPEDGSRQEKNQP